MATSKCMWLPLLFLSAFLALSEETCEYSRKRNYQFSIKDQYIDYLYCTDLTLESNDFRRQVNVIQITNSNIPILNSDFVTLINAKTLILEAKVETIEDYAFRNTTLSVINLDYNHITKIKTGSFYSNNITSLSLSHNSVHQILSQNFLGLLNLVELFLADNAIIDIQPFSLKDLQSLERLSLANNVLDNLPDAIFRTSKYLRELDLSGNHFETLNQAYFEENLSLRKLYLRNNFLTKLDLTNFPTSLTGVDASKNNLITFNVSNLVKLDTLVLDGNNLTTVQESLGNVPSLKVLSLNQNRIVNGSFRHLVNLTSLYLEGNNLSGFYIDFPANLRLSMDNNNFTELEFKVGVVKLSSLSLSGNFLSSIKNLSNVQGLKELSLDRNLFKEITFELFKGLNGLIRLSLSRNSINSLATGCFADLTSLLTLDLSCNRLTVFPSSVFGGLRSLLRLNLSHNHICDFNEGSLYPLKTLTKLDMSFNNLSWIDLKMILQHSPRLFEVNVNGNRWTCKVLIDLVRENRFVNFTMGRTVNVSNVYGIECSEEEEDEEDGTLDEKRFLLELLNSTRIAQVENMRDVTLLLALISFYLAVVISLMCGKLIYKWYLTRRRQGRGILEESNGQSMHLN